MRLTIEVENIKEIEQLLHIINALNMQNINIVYEKNIKSKEESDILPLINRPLQKKLDIDAIKKAKNYKGVDRKKFNSLIKEINIQEPIEQLISQLSA
jgi:hypothetical protein